MAMIQCPDCTQPVSNKAFSCPHCGLQAARGRHKLPRLAAVACVFVIVASIGEVTRLVRETMGAVATPYGKLDTSASTNAMGAHVTLTNTTTTTRFACFRGVVKRANGASAPVYSATVCSGDLKPHTTIALEAPYDPGAVERICSAEGTHSIDWDLCTFDLEPATAL
jgi:hypothetical protein